MERAHVDEASSEATTDSDIRTDRRGRILWHLLGLSVLLSAATLLAPAAESHGNGNSEMSVETK